MPTAGRMPTLTTTTSRGGRGTSHTLGLNWYWNAYARMQFNAIYGEIDDAAINNGDNTGNPADALSGNYTILGARFMIDF